MSICSDRERLYQYILQHFNTENSKNKKVEHFRLFSTLVIKAFSQNLLSSIKDIIERKCDNNVYYI